MVTTPSKDSSDMNKEETYMVQDLQEIPLDFDHYKTLTEALADAIKRCMVWRDTEKGNPHTGKNLYEFAQRHDEQFVLDEDDFYMVSLEGAIGLSPGLEWLTQWMFVPMEPGEERDQLLENMKEELRKEEMAQPRFCPQCGAQVKADLKFCTQCGTKLDTEPAAAPTPEQEDQPVPTEAEEANPMQDEATMDTMDDKEKLNRYYAEEAAYLGHYHYMLQALYVAFSRCKVWRTADGGEAVSINKLFNFAKEYDTNHPLEAGAFFMVTLDGAIGLSPGAEWLTQWLFIPMEPCEERDRLIQQMTEKFEQHEHPQPTMKFCPNCGKPITPEMKFCANCGTRIAIN